jgi:hypothetical protein
LSNQKKKGENNRKNGNKYLGWAYIEAANFIRRYCPEAKAWYQRKAARTKAVVATKALASKLSKACYFIMKDQVDFDVQKIFGSMGCGREPKKGLINSPRTDWHLPHP